MQVPPVQVSVPSGKTFASDTGLDFRWTPYPSPYVKEYELTLYKLGTSGGAPTLLNKMSLPFDADRTSQLAGVLFPGTYAWKIEAKDERGDPVARGGARFIVVPETRRFRVLLGIDFFRSNYQSSGTHPQYAAEVPSADVDGFSGSVDYYFNAKWRLLLDVKTSKMKFGNESLGFSSYSLGAIRRHGIGKKKRWHSYFGARFVRDGLPEITASSYNAFRISHVDRTLFLPIAGAEFQIAPPVLAFAQLELNKTLALSGGAFGEMTANRSPIGYRVTTGFQGNIDGPYGYDASIAYFKDGFAYSTSTVEPSVTFSGYDMRLALTYHF
jgi:hypothetical protein